MCSIHYKSLIGNRLSSIVKKSVFHHYFSDDKINKLQVQLNIYNDKFVHLSQRTLSEIK